MLQDHTAYPHITHLVKDVVHRNGGIVTHQIRECDPDKYVEKKLDECLGADGVYHEDVSKIDAWIGKLDPVDYLIIADSNVDIVDELCITAPTISEGSVREFLDATFEHCI